MEDYELMLADMEAMSVKLATANTEIAELQADLNRLGGEWVESDKIKDTEIARLTEIIKQQGEQLRLALEDRDDAITESHLAEALRELAVTRRALEIACQHELGCTNCPCKEDGCTGDVVYDACAQYHLDRARAEQEPKPVIVYDRSGELTGMTPREPNDPSITVVTTTNAEGKEYVQAEPNGAEQDKPNTEPTERGFACPPGQQGDCENCTDHCDEPFADREQDTPEGAEP